MERKGIYLREKDELVGPFCSRGDAERFLIAMTLCGESLEGIEIVEIDSAANSVPNAVSAKERKRLLKKVKKSPRLKRR